MSLLGLQYVVNFIAMNFGFKDYVKSTYLLMNYTVSYFHEIFSSERNFLIFHSTVLSSLEKYFVKSSRTMWWSISIS